MGDLGTAEDFQGRGIGRTVVGWENQGSESRMTFKRS